MAKKHRFDYFDAFERQSELACQEAKVLVGLLEDFRPREEGWGMARLAEMHAIENEADNVNHDIMTNLAEEFMPPLDREDISELAQYLDDVVDDIEEVVQHLYMYNIMELHPNALKVAHIISESTEALLEAMKVFREFKKPKKLNRLLAAVHDKESLGDDLYIESKRDLFVNHADGPAAYLIAWNSMFSHMEQCCDACEHVASLMRTIAIKNL
ncbi:MAG: DUF47 family protein [Coriobacteriia bacterium]|nr:DUF47 family protein [Coriobacteriia bacterium]MBS5477499.1 DUF47 family protein [Coriobacteriia bacterium]